LFHCKIFFFACFSHFYFGVDIKHYSFLCRPWLQLNKEVKIFGYFTINGRAVLFY
jgi:dolichyl-phosphate-mannose--protein O-mannosyl transferase